ncbi:MAG: hypothetical protein KIS97_04240 [Nitrospira sp.]|nr:hypothetical protein [Nitrospira sp.]
MERTYRTQPHRFNGTFAHVPRWRCCLAAAGLFLLTSTTLFANPIEVIYPEGVSEGFVTLKTLDGKKLADGELSQVTTGADRLASRLTFRFADGSLYDETVAFSQKKHLTMLSYQLTQRGPAFPEPLVISLNGETGQYQVRQREKTPDEKLITGRLDLPKDVYNGLTITVLKNLRGQTGAIVHMLVFNPEPKLYEVELARVDEEDTRNTTRKETKATAVHYSLKPRLGWFTAALARLLGRTPPDYHFWLIKKDAPAFVRFEGSLYAGGPSWRIEQVSPRVKQARVPEPW